MEPVVAVDQDQHEGEYQDFRKRIQHVLRWQEQVEVVVVGTVDCPLKTVLITLEARYAASRPTMYSGMTATKPAIMRVVTRNGTDGTAMTSSASISSEIRMAPS